MYVPWKLWQGLELQLFVYPLSQLCSWTRAGLSWIMLGFLFSKLGVFQCGNPFWCCVFFQQTGRYKGMLDNPGRGQLNKKSGSFPVPIRV